MFWLAYLSNLAIQISMFLFCYKIAEQAFSYGSKVTLIITTIVQFIGFNSLIGLLTFYFFGKELSLWSVLIVSVSCQIALYILFRVTKHKHKISDRVWFQGNELNFCIAFFTIMIAIVVIKLPNFLPSFGNVDLVGHVWMTNLFHKSFIEDYPLFNFHIINSPFPHLEFATNIFSYVFGLAYQSALFAVFLFIDPIYVLSFVSIFLFSLFLASPLLFIQSKEIQKYSLIILLLILALIIPVIRMIGNGWMAQLFGVAFLFPIMYSFDFIDFSRRQNTFFISLILISHFFASSYLLVFYAYVVFVIIFFIFQSLNVKRWFSISCILGLALLPLINLTIVKNGVLTFIRSIIPSLDKPNSVEALHTSATFSKYIYTEQIILLYSVLLLLIVSFIYRYNRGKVLSIFLICCVSTMVLIFGKNSYVAVKTIVMLLPITAISFFLIFDSLVQKQNTTIYLKIVLITILTVGLYWGISNGRIIRYSNAFEREMIAEDLYDSVKKVIINGNSKRTIYAALDGPQKYLIRGLTGVGFIEERRNKKIKFTQKQTVSQIFHSFPFLKKDTLLNLLYDSTKGRGDKYANFLNAEEVFHQGNYKQVQFDRRSIEIYDINFKDFDLKSDSTNCKIVNQKHRKHVIKGASLLEQSTIRITNKYFPPGKSKMLISIKGRAINKSTATITISNKVTIKELDLANFSGFSTVIVDGFGPDQDSFDFTLKFKGQKHLSDTYFKSIRIIFI